MKRALFCLAAMLLLFGAVMAADGPVDKGSMVLGGTLFFQNQSGDLYESGGEALTTIRLMPSVGYFVAPNIMIGGQVDFSSLSQGGSSYTFWTAGPVVGYYFNLDQTRTEIKGAIYPYLRAFFMYGQESNSYDATGMMFGGQGGAVFMLSNAVGVDANLMERTNPQPEQPSGLALVLLLSSGRRL